MSQEKAVAVVIKSKGEATIEHNGKKLEVKRGSKIYINDKIETSSNANIAFRYLDDKSLVRVDANTAFTVKGEREGTSISKNLSMEVGNLFANVTKQKSGSFRITTPRAAATVKGTSFGVVFDSNDNSIVYVYEGLVGVESDGKSKDAGAGFVLVTKKDGSQEQLPLNDETKKRFGLSSAEDFQGADELELEFESNNGQNKKIKIKILDNE